MRPQTQVRKMRRPGLHHGRKTDGTRQNYHDPAIRAARRARDRSIRLAGRTRNQEG